MYEPLRDLSPEYLLPGLKHVPQNTVGLLRTNRKFIEAYHVGLSHGFAQEALFHELPVPLDTTYFRQFWDVSGFVPPEAMEDDIEEELRHRLGDESYEALSETEHDVEFDKLLKERLKDITQIRLWNGRELGDNAVRQSLQVPRSDEEDQEEKLVLLIRGDLLKKYPETLIFAVKAEWKIVEGAWKRRPIFDFKDENTKFPIFRGTLPPDITFFGFDLTESQARGCKEIGTSEPPETRNPAGWFITLQQMVGKDRWAADVLVEGDPPTLDKWDALTWQHLLQGDPPMSDSGYVDGADPGAVQSDETIAHPWDSDSAHRAWILIQKPVRIAIHADDMTAEES